MAASEVSEVQDLIWSVQCSQREKAEADAEVAKWEKLASEARVRSNRALMQELSTLSRLDRFDLTDEQLRSMGL